MRITIHVDDDEIRRVLGSLTASPTQPQLAPTARLLTVPEVAETLALSPSKVYQLLYSGQLQSVAIGRARRVPTEALSHLLTQPAASVVIRSPRPKPRRTVPRELRALSPSDPAAGGESQKGDPSEPTLESNRTPHEVATRKQRRGWGEGSIFQRKDGRWEAQLRTEGGGRRSFYGRTRREAQEKLHAAHQVPGGRVWNQESNTSLGDYLDAWIETFGAPTVRERTLRSYRLNVKRIKQSLGLVQLRALTPSAIQTFYAALLARGLAPRSVWQVHMLLHRALKQAAFSGVISRNPVDGVARPRASHDEVRTLTHDELKQLFNATTQHRLHALWVLLATTGIRLGEALGLKWADVDLDSNRISIRHSLQYLRGTGFVLGEPKTPKSRRMVFLAPGTGMALKEHRARQLAEREAARNLWQPVFDLVFTSVTGKPLQDGHVSWCFHHALEDAGLRRMRIHDLRHTAASLLLEQGVHPKVVQELLGHSTITVTLDTYSHVVPGLHAEVAERMQELFL